MMQLIEQRTLSLPFIQAGQEIFGPGNRDGRGDGWVHHKTVPYTIIAQATEGRYGIKTGTGGHAELLTGEAFLTAPDLPLEITHHCDRRTNRMRIRFVHFNFLLYGTVNLARLAPLPLAVPAAWAHRFGDIAERLLSLQQGTDKHDLRTTARIKASGYELMSVLLDFLKVKGREPELRPGLFRLLPVLERIEASLRRPLAVGELAALASLSVPHFHAEFKKELGTSPHAYVMRRRLARACDLLRTGTQPLEAVGDAAGFSSAYHLGREFKRKYGVPPGEFRRRYKDGFVV